MIDRDLFAQVTLDLVHWTSLYAEPRCRAAPTCLARLTASSRRRVELATANELASIGVINFELGVQFVKPNPSASRSGTGALVRRGGGSRPEPSPWRARSRRRLTGKRWYAIVALGTTPTFVGHTPLHYQSQAREERHLAGDRPRAHPLERGYRPRAPKGPATLRASSCATTTLAQSAPEHF